MAAALRPPLAYHLAESPLGWVLLAADASGLRALLLADSPEAALEELAQRFVGAALVAEPSLSGDMAQILRRLEQPDSPLDLPLAPAGTPFQQRVWQALGEIAAGQTVSYAALAARLGSHPRAVARACASNPLAVLIPCHRVVNSRGQLAGYRWGLARKAALLARERQPLAGA